jgi:hypothetical protein
VYDDNFQVYGARKVWRQLGVGERLKTYFSEHRRRPENMLRKKIERYRK